MIILIPLVVALILWVVILYVSDLDFDIPEPFACGSDEICYCEESNDCIKKK